MWYELNEGNKLILKQYSDITKQYINTLLFYNNGLLDKELINIDDMWEMIEQLCYKLEEVEKEV